MHEEKFVLAVVKKFLVELTKSGDMEFVKDTALKVLGVLIDAEADAIIGTPEMIDHYVDQLFEKEEEN